MTRLGRQSVSEQIKDALLERILTGVYEPGDRLVELRIAEEFGTSQGPVREAIQGLVARRLLEASPHRGTRVREISVQEMVETFEVRGFVEQAAAELISRNQVLELTKLRGLAASIDRAAASADVEAYAEQDRLFHRSIVASAHHDVLLRTWDDLRMQVRIKLVVSRIIPSLERFANEHHTILDAFEERDFVLAGDLLRAHTDHICDEIRSFEDLA